jgi:hypothetical protein
MLVRAGHVQARFVLYAVCYWLFLISEQISQKVVIACWHHAWAVKCTERERVQPGVLKPPCGKTKTKINYTTAKQ